MIAYPVTDLPFPEPTFRGLAEHVTRRHGTDPGTDVTSAAHAHLNAHVRGEFADGIHFHKGD